MLKRISLFILLNILVIGTIGFLLTIFNVRPYITPYGINYEQLLAFCSIWGIGGAFISLLLSKWMAKMMMGVKVIPLSERDLKLQGVREMVHRIAQKAGMKTMPEVGIFESTMPNAFATGPTASHSLVALSTGLLTSLSEEEVEAVVGHEITHITNGDMVTMTLLQGVVNAFVMFFARALALALSGFGRNDSKRGSWMSYYLFTILFETVFFLLGYLVIAGFSRWREYRADRGGAYLSSKQNMIHALQGLERVKTGEGKQVADSVRAFMISSGKPRTLFSLFATHPPISKRIEALEKLKQVRTQEC